MAFFVRVLSHPLNDSIGTSPGFWISGVCFAVAESDHAGGGEAAFFQKVVFFQKLIDFFWRKTFDRTRVDSKEGCSGHHVAHGDIDLASRPIAKGSGGSGFEVLF